MKHRHEFKMRYRVLEGEDWAFCQDCPEFRKPEEIESILNDYERLKRATDALKKITDDDWFYILDGLPYDWEPYHILDELRGKEGDDETE